MSEIPASEGSAETADRAESVRLLFARPWDFLIGARSLGDLPPLDRTELAFAGRSNVGKSSLINALTGQSGLARTSNTPGRTRELNFFLPEAEAGLLLVDMPGYGYAKAPKTEVAQWSRLIHDYLRGRANLRRVFVLVDARHGIKPSDETIMNEFDKTAVPYQIVLTKADKIKPAELEAVKADTADRIRKRPASHPTIIATSAEKGWGMEELRTEISAFTSD
ncbi:GTP-binding protein [Faunimonas pinastri]|uniref:Probable GTP-binding protein EngB n=1 Tax=Faunimonas pinastri TaxID=1855383 RepID=A0A1H9HDL8_9HYPH|nr:ribosome biogenesis GTP-binding protein YihA/YsxC [Faunimonas pinastri]SEQ60402.1 GTP-binding protein [Faunimonas pinastri]